MSVAIIIYLLRTQLELLFVLSQRTRCVPLILRYILLRFLDNCITSSFHTSKYLLSLTKKCLNYRREIKKKQRLKSYILPVRITCRVTKHVTPSRGYRFRVRLDRYVLRLIHSIHPYAVLVILKVRKLLDVARRFVNRRRSFRI